MENRPLRCHTGEMENETPVTGDQTARGVADAYDRYRHELVRFATVLVGPDAANDVLSSAVLALLERRGVAPLRNPRAYLYQAVANQARNHRRSEGRRRRRESNSAARDESMPAEAYPEVREAIEQLSVRQRAVVYLTYWEDMSEEGVAGHLGISVGSVRTHLARARRHLRRSLHAHVT